MKSPSLNPLNKQVYKVYNEFRVKQGSQHIATISSLFNLTTLLDGDDLSLILDFGAGIGTITQLCLDITKAKIVCYERNEWCKEQLKANVSDIARIEVTSNFPNGRFDLIAIDDDISRKEIRRILKNCRPRVIFIEGYRNRTVGQVSKRLLLYGYTAKFVRGKSQEIHFSELLSNEDMTRIKGEKAGAWFVLSEGNHYSNFISWIKRLLSTGEIIEVLKESYFAISRKVAIRSRIRKLKR